MSATNESFDFNGVPPAVDVPAAAEPVPNTTPTAPIASTSSASSPAAGSLPGLLTWKDPVATGKVFGGLVAALILVKVNVLNYVFYVAYLGLLVSAGAEYAGKLVTGQGFVTKFHARAPSYARVVNEQVLPAVGEFASCLEGRVQRIIYAHDIELTLKAAGVSYILYFVTSFVSLYTLVFTAVILAFTFPPFYLQNKDEIDAAVAHFTKLVKAKTAEVSSQAQKAVGPHLDAFAKKTGPVGKFIQTRFPTRTAGSTVGASKIDTSYELGTGSQPVAVEKPLDGAGTAHTTGSSFPTVPSSTPAGVTVDEPVSVGTTTHEAAY